MPRGNGARACRGVRRGLEFPPGPVGSSGLAEGGVNRREVLASGTALLALPTPAMAQATGLREAAREAWLYCAPSVLSAHVRDTVLERTPLNSILYMQDAATARTQLVTSPNNDTINSRGFVDLTRGPVELTLPAADGRYSSVMLEDMYTNDFAVLGPRTSGRRGGRHLLVGPGDAAPPGAIRSPTPHMFVLSRTLFRDRDDLPAAVRFQAGVTLRGPAGAPARPAPGAPIAAPWEAFFSAAGRLLMENPPPVTDDAALARFAPVGLTRAGWAPPALSPADRQAVSEGVAEARTLAKSPTGGLDRVGGWGYPQANIGVFGQDYLFRAQTAATGIFALPQDEVIYPRALGDDGRGAFGGASYRLRFAPGATPPVDAFWSLTLYEVQADGRLLFTDNAIDRYSIGDRTRGLRTAPDGGLELWISRTDPGSDRRANWLPAPAAGAPFVLSCRCYWPRSELRTGAYRLPEVERVA